MVDAPSISTQPEPASAVLDVRLASDMENLPSLMQQLQAFAKQHAWQETESMQMQLMVEELVVNAITPGANGRLNAWLRLVVRHSEQSIDLELTDNGIAFDPLSANAPDFDLALESREVGGLGIHFVRQMADAAHYVRTQYAGEAINQLRISKKRV